MVRAFSYLVVELHLKAMREEDFKPLLHVSSPIELPPATNITINLEPINGEHCRAAIPRPSQ